MEVRLLKSAQIHVKLRAVSLGGIHINCQIPYLLVDVDRKGILYSACMFLYHLHDTG